MAHRGQAGFTLAELLATLAIAGIAVSLSLNGFSQAASEQRRASATNQLVGTLHLARSVAMTRNQPVTICPSDDQKRCASAGWEHGWIAFVDAELDREPGPEGVLLTEPPLAGKLRLRSDQFADFLSYRPNGQAMANTSQENTGQFRLCDAAELQPVRTILINATGNPRLGDQQVNASSTVCSL